jgi:hypothetical protein
MPRAKVLKSTKSQENAKKSMKSNIIVANDIADVEVKKGQREDVKRGRPRKFETVSWFGMKMNPEDRQKIKTLAQLEGKTASRLILDLVEAHFRKRAGRITFRELMKLPTRERERILEGQARKAADFYQSKKAA